MSVVERIVQTSHADIAVAESLGEKVPVVLIHGNSSCKEVFRHQLKSSLGKAHRMVAIDLPGHGRSSDAVDPERTYTMPGYADAVIEALGVLGIKKAVVYGWSLGGHVGLEMLPRFPGMVGLMITGAPPVGNTPEAVQAGFKPNPNVGLFGKPDFTAEELATFVGANYGAQAEPFLVEAAKRADGRSRAVMFASLLSGQVSDQRKLAENASVPMAVVNGAEDPVVNTDYVGSLSYRDLWDEHCFILRGLGHAPFFQGPKAFNPIFGRFLADMDARAARKKSKTSARGSSEAAAA